MFGSFGYIELFAIFMFFIGFFALITSDDAVKSIVATVLLQTGVIMFWVTFGFEANIIAPIGFGVADYLGVVPIADPVPQALMITAIIIGMAITAINLIMLISLTRKYKTTVWTELRDGHNKNYGEEI